MTRSTKKLWENEDIPRDMTQVRVDHSVRAIKINHSFNCMQLRTAILNNGLKEIGKYAMSGCRSIEIPPAIKAIRGGGGIPRLLRFDNCDSQQWAGGD